MIPRRLEILALGNVHAAGELLDWLSDELRARFGFRTVALRALPEDPGWREPPGEQLSSNRIVDALVDRAADHGTSHEEQWTLAVTDADLTAPDRDFVIGEATLGGGWALVSTARLAGTDGLSPHSDRLRHRLLTEAVHELGHLAGLPHCETPRCVMQPSVTAEDIDAKSPDFCSGCRTALGRA